MNPRSRALWNPLLILGLVVALTACGGDSTPEPEPPVPTDTAPAPASPATATPTPTVEAQAPAVDTPTPTPTAAPLPMATTPAPAASRCQGLAGQLEVQVLVGPAEAVGLEPVAVGNVPFSVTSSEPPYAVTGQGPIYYEAVLEREWGTYSVTMNMDNAVDGACSGEAGNEQLNLTLEMTGEQLVVVDAGGFHGEYPWSGTQSRPLAFPLEDGATAQGEGWAVVLHLGTP
jgi:hypothetical protein